METDSATTFFGFVRKESDAYELFQLAISGSCSLVKERLNDKQRKQVAPGQIYIYDEQVSKIQRWTDGESWSDSCNYGEFQVYREVELVARGSSRTKTEKRNGMRKKTVSDRRFGSRLRLVCYYNEQMENVLQKMDRLPFIPNHPHGMLYTYQMLLAIAAGEMDPPESAIFLLLSSFPYSQELADGSAVTLPSKKRRKASSPASDGVSVSPSESPQSRPINHYHRLRQHRHRDYRDDILEDEEEEEDVDIDQGNNGHMSNDAVLFVPKQEELFELASFPFVEVYPNGVFESQFKTEMISDASPSTNLFDENQEAYFQQSKQPLPLEFQSNQAYLSSGQLASHLPSSSSIVSSPQSMPAINGPLVIKTANPLAPFMEVQYPGGMSCVYLNSEGSLRVEQQGKEADFAEMMEASTEEAHLMAPGSVVNLVQGQLSTFFDDRAVIPRIVSTSPLIVGRASRSEDKGKAMVKVAMVGQVPVKIKGIASKGDFIIAGRRFGEVFAVPERMVTLEMFGRVCGVALTDAFINPLEEFNIVSALVFYPDVNFLTRDLEMFKQSMSATATLVTQDLQHLQSLFAATKDQVMTVNTRQEELESHLKLTSQNLEDIRLINESITVEQTKLRAQTSELTSMVQSLGIEGGATEDDALQQYKMRQKRRRLWLWRAMLVLAFVLLFSSTVGISAALDYDGDDDDDDCDSSSSTGTLTNNQTTSSVDIILLYRSGFIPFNSSLLDAFFILKSPSSNTSPLPLRDISFRYYLTVPLHSSIACSIVSAGEVPPDEVVMVSVATRPLENANHYIGISFPKSSLALTPDQELDFIQLLCQTKNNEPLDYDHQFSFTPTITFESVNNIPVYYKHTLLFGHEPDPI